LDGYTGSFSPAQAEAEISQSDLDRITERSNADNLDLFPLEQAHFQKALDEVIVSHESLHARPLPKLNLVHGNAGHARPRKKKAVCRVGTKGT
jgi:hypothetical protein